MAGGVLRPRVGRNVFVAPSAWVEGDVTIGDDCTLMHHVVARGDVAPIRIGARVNIQDGGILHTKTGVPLEIGDDVGVGHRAIVHCESVGAHTLIGMGAILLDDVVVGRDCFIAAGALLPPAMRVPDGKLVMGVPARIVGDVQEKHLAYTDFVVSNYLTLNRNHAAGVYERYVPPSVGAGSDAAPG
ncbi:MAG: gamma carbonic anhydrase family protein [Planctomycetota bacterium]|nr:MAG: gamma carbonic anhydrase family protein [Planctomycetota bacterium]